ncbi:MAG: sterol desaturase family protein [Bacteroidetes bacterium]|nr:sterol desaturase family protein [Bacteroidota bacterium]
MENKPNFKGSRRLFKNPFLEKLTHTHIAIPLTIFSIYAVALLYWSYDHQYLNFVSTVLVFLSGVLLFSLVEYLMHRYLFHLPPTSDFNKKVAYIVHGIHHDYPKDKDLLAMPPVLSIILATLFLLLFKSIMGNVGFAFTAGFVVGYASYLWVHFMIHAYMVPQNFFKVLWIHHSIHHYKRPDKAFGVSSPLWDYVFRTMP